MDRAALLDRPPDVECIVEKVRRTEGIVRVEHFVQKGGRRLKGWRLGQPSTVHDIRWSSKDGFGQIIIRLDIDGGPDRYTYYQTIYGYHEVLTQQSVDTRPVDTRRPFALAIERNIRTACGVEELAHVKETCIGVRCI